MDTLWLYGYYAIMVIVSCASLVFSAMGYFAIRRHLKSIDRTTQRAVKNIEKADDV